ncbi:MAG: DUF6503 family protein [Flavobacteriaceae bacterium]
MKNFYPLMITVLLVFAGCNKALTADQILQKSIEYHDPEDRWLLFSDSLRITLESPNVPNRLSTIYMDNKAGVFYVKAARDSNIVEYGVGKASCLVKWNGSSDFSLAEAEEHGLNCERAKMYRNYYTYLYGLPMKLKDSGTLLNKEVESKTFKGKEYLVLRADYDAEVGTDIWYFYFDPQSYAMEVYQFYRSDENGQIKEDTGEYILLSGEAEVGKIRMPKTRAWYYNKDDKYLGTDILK